MRVNIDDKIESDPRVTLAAAALEISRFEFIGRCIPVWMAAYRNRSAVMPKRNVDALAQHPGFAEAMLQEDLATPVGDDLVAVRLRGVTERIEFLEIQDAKRLKANEAKRAKAGLPPACPPGPPPAARPGLPYSLTPTPTPDQAQDHTLAPEVAADAAPALHPEAVRLAWKLHGQVAQALPGRKAPKKAPEATVMAWADDIEKLERIDGVPYADIDAVLTWLPTDNFWPQNIRSGTKLREKYDDLLAKRNASKSTGRAAGRAEPSPPSAFEADKETQF